MINFQDILSAFFNDFWFLLKPYVFPSILISVGIFFLVREIVTWYFKLNKIVFLLESIDKKIK